MILMTIRNHVDKINSHLSYNREEINSKMFLRLENKEDLHFGSLDYYKHKIFLEKFMRSWKIKLVPMEIISNKGFNEFIKEVTFKDILIHGNLNIHENSNVNSKSNHVMRKTNFINIIMFRKMHESYQKYSNTKRFKRSNLYYYGFLFFTYRLLY